MEREDINNIIYIILQEEVAVPWSIAYKVRSIIHVYRESNQGADILGNLGSKMHRLGIHASDVKEYSFGVLRF